MTTYFSLVPFRQVLTVAAPTDSNIDVRADRPTKASGKSDESTGLGQHSHSHTNNAKVKGHERRKHTKCTERIILLPQVCRYPM